MNAKQENKDLQHSKKFIVCIDNGHGVDTPGKCSPDRSLLEWQWNREVAIILKNILKDKNIDSVIIVTEYTDISLKERCRRINKIASEVGKKNCVSVSIHINAAGGDGKWHSAQGWSVFVSPNASEKSKMLANEMWNFAKAHGFKTRQPLPNQHYWVKSLAMCRDTSCPAVLVENLFMDNETDCYYLKQEATKVNLAQVMADAIESYMRSL